MTLRIKFDSSVPLGVQARVAIWCEREIGEIAELPESNKFRWFEWATISGVVSAMIAAVILVLKLQSDHIIPTEKRPLDIDHLTAVMKGALLQYRISDIQLREVVGIGEPNKAGGDIYRINIINTFNNREYIVLIIKDGESHVLRLGA